MRSMAVWIGAVLMAAGLWSASGVSQGLADEPAASSSSSDGTGGAAGNETGGSKTVPPVVEGEPGPPSEAGEVQERAIRQRAGSLGESGSCVCLGPLGNCVYSAIHGCVPSSDSTPCNRGCIEQKPTQGFGGTKAFGTSTGTTTEKLQILPDTKGLAIPRGVEGEPPTTAPAGQEDKAPAPK